MVFVVPVREIGTITVVIDDSDREWIAAGPLHGSAIHADGHGQRSCRGSSSRRQLVDLVGAIWHDRSKGGQSTYYELGFDLGKRKPSLISHGDIQFDMQSSFLAVFRSWRTELSTQDRYDISKRLTNISFAEAQLLQPCYVAEFITPIFEHDDSPL